MEGEKMNVLSIVGKRSTDAQNESAIEILSELLELAKEGKVVGVAAVTYAPDRSLTTHTSGGAEAELLLGGTQCLGHRLLKQIYRGID
jgi:hypothetical protein